MEIRVALALFVVLCGALGGRALSDGAKRRAEALRVLSEATRRLRVHMTSMFEPVPVALEHADCELFSMVARSMEGGVSAEAAWACVERKATKRGGILDSLTQADREALDRMFSGLGQSGREEQDLLLSGVAEALEGQHRLARDKLRESEKLYGTLGLLIGLMLALIVI